MSDSEDSPADVRQAMSDSEDSPADVRQAMSDSEDSPADVRDSIQLQLVEVEMLQSMFANPGEFTLDSQLVLEELQAFVDGTIDYDAVESRVGFTIKIATSSSPACEVELSCFFPHEYPTVHPEVFLRASAIDRKSHSSLTEDLNEYLISLGTGNILIGSLVEWLQQNAHIYLSKDAETNAEECSSRKSSKKEDEFMRLWIYSHHIYSKVKRQNIMDWSSELELNGFSLPGKPGVICVEGLSDSVDEFWYRIRRLNWKRLMIKEQEVERLGGREVGELCRFGALQELDLEVVEGKGRSYHMHLGKFRHFLQQHGCAHIFPLYFGVEGKSAGD